jgi:carboxypeptidase family protein
MRDAVFEYQPQTTQRREVTNGSCFGERKEAASCRDPIHGSRMGVVVLRTSLLVAMMCAAGAWTSVLAQTVGTGHISGQVTDKSGAALPGVRVTITGPTLHQEAITDADGRFGLEGLVQGWPSTYAITAELVGFAPAIVERIKANVGGDVSVRIALEVAPVCEILWVDLGLAENLRLADAVFLVRIESSSSTRPAKLPDYCVHSTEYVATVIDTVKDTHRTSPTSVRFSVLSERNNEHNSSSEYIAFLRWEPSIGRYQVLMPQSYFVPATGGWVDWPALKTVGLPSVSPVSAALEALRSLSEQR